MHSEKTRIAWPEEETTENAVLFVKRKENTSQRRRMSSIVALWTSPFLFDSLSPFFVGVGIPERIPKNPEAHIPRDHLGDRIQAFRARLQPRLLCSWLCGWLCGWLCSWLWSWLSSWLCPRASNLDAKDLQTFKMKMQNTNKIPKIWKYRKYN